MKKGGRGGGWRMELSLPSWPRYPPCSPSGSVLHYTGLLSVLVTHYLPPLWAFSLALSFAWNILSAPVHRTNSSILLVHSKASLPSRNPADALS